MYAVSNGDFLVRMYEQQYCTIFDEKDNYKAIYVQSTFNSDNKKQNQIYQTEEHLSCCIICFIFWTMHPNSFMSFVSVIMLKQK